MYKSIYTCTCAEYDTRVMRLSTPLHLLCSAPALGGLHRRSGPRKLDSDFDYYLAISPQYIATFILLWKDRAGGCIIMNPPNLPKKFTHNLCSPPFFACCAMVEGERDDDL